MPKETIEMVSDFVFRNGLASVVALYLLWFVTWERSALDQEFLDIQETMLEVKQQQVETSNRAANSWEKIAVFVELEANYQERFLDAVEVISEELQKDSRE